VSVAALSISENGPADDVISSPLKDTADEFEQESQADHLMKDDSPASTSPPTERSARRGNAGATFLLAGRMKPGLGTWGSLRHGGCLGSRVSFLPTAWLVPSTSLLAALAVAFGIPAATASRGHPA
jgi:hypothetical protein